MLLVVFILYLTGTACSYNLVCSDQSKSSVTFQPSDDLGRYTAEICTRIQPNVTIWSVDLLYNDKATACNRTHHSRNPGKLHSEFILRSLDQELKNVNCTFVCLSIYFDMIFSSCYMIKSTFFQDENEFPPYDTYHNITNKFSIKHFEDDTSVSLVNHEKYISIYFFLVAPPTDYVVQLCDANSTSTDFPCRSVSANCTRGGRAGGTGVAGGEGDARVDCELVGVRGCHRIELEYVAPWTTGVFANRSKVDYCFCTQVEGEGAGALSGSDWRVAWACGALLVAAAALLVLWRRRDAMALHKRVLRYWTERSETEAAGEAGAGEAAAAAGACRHVLLVYAREGAAGQRAAEALRALVRRGTGAAVHDVFSADTMAAAAAGGAPAEWVRALVARADCRVLVLQTPALACVRAEAEPLLPGRKTYRVPQFGDSLAQFALRLLAHSDVHRSDHREDLPAYKKYYLATLSDLETEVFPHVVPFRRYVLPDAAPLLLRDLAGAGAGAGADTALQQPAGEAGEALQRLREAAHEFAAHARADPDYLLEELVLV